MANAGACRRLPDAVSSQSSGSSDKKMLAAAMANNCRG
jgi:hypothetical protein